MKKNIFKCLLLGICCSVLFSIGSFANSEDSDKYPVSSSISDILLDQKTESGDGYYDEFCVIIRLGDNFSENAGYYKLDLDKTFRETLCDRPIKELISPTYANISKEGGAIIYFAKTGSDGGCVFLDLSELYVIGITPDNVSYNPQIGYLISVDKVGDYTLYFEKLDECPSGGVKLYGFVE